MKVKEGTRRRGRPPKKQTQHQELKDTWLSKSSGEEEDGEGASENSDAGDVEEKGDESKNTAGDASGEDSGKDSGEDSGNEMCLRETLKTANMTLARVPATFELKALHDELKGATIVRKFGGTKDEPGYPNYGWVTGKVTRRSRLHAKAAGLHCEVRFAGTPGTGVHPQMLLPSAYFRGTKPDTADLGSWAFTTAKK